MTTIYMSPDFGKNGLRILELTPAVIDSVLGRPFTINGGPPTGEAWNYCEELVLSRSNGATKYELIIAARTAIPMSTGGVNGTLLWWSGKIETWGEVYMFARTAGISPAHKRCSRVIALFYKPEYANKKPPQYAFNPADGEMVAMENPCALAAKIDAERSAMRKAAAPWTRPLQDDEGDGYHED